MPDSSANSRPPGLISAIVAPFLSSHLAGIFLFLAFSLGFSAIIVTPKEEEPQIVVPMADISVSVPGASPEEVENLVAIPLEKLLWQTDGVEYVYSVSSRDRALITVRFFVGEDREDSLVKLHNRVVTHQDVVPDIVKDWHIKPVEINDVPIVNLTLYSPDRSDYELKRIGEELLTRLSETQDVSRTRCCGGRSREIRVELDPAGMAGYGITPLEVVQAVQQSDYSLTLGSIDVNNRHFSVQSDAYFDSVEELRNLAVGQNQGDPFYLKDVARIIDGPEEPENYSRIGFSREFKPREGPGADSGPMSAVTLALAKKKGTNAVDVADNILANLEKLRPLIVPDDVYVEVTRNYGETARKKVDGLLASLGFAILTVVAVLAFTLGWKASLVVAVSIPVSFSLALFCSYLMGFTINRVTLFALILSLGLVVDDPITNVDNIKRHMRMKYPGPGYATLAGVAEVFPPVLMSTLAIIACFLPLFFITGMMGPYMAPMAANVPLTVIFSTISALTIVPWMCRKLMGNNVSSGQGNSDDSGVPQWILRFYKALIKPFLDYGLMRVLLFGLVSVLLLAALLLAVFRMVPLKMLPFDNKDEFQIVIDMPRGTTLERTDRVVRDFEDYFEDVPSVTSFVSYTGQASPMDFNGMVRQYYLRGAPEEAEVRVNLQPAEQREEQSHALVLGMRKDLEEIAEKHGAVLKIVEMPPGPPVMATIVAEIYADPDKTYPEMIQASEKIRRLMENEEFVRDVDDSVKESNPRFTFVLDREKADIHGIRAARIIDTLAAAVQGVSPAALHSPWERRTVPIRMILPERKRSSLAELENIRIRSSSGELVPLGELGEFQVEADDQPVLHKNLKRVVYVTAEMAGQPPAEAILDMQSSLEKNPLPEGFEVNWRGEGEWKITLDVFRDLGIAFGAALLGIYLLLIIQTGSLSMPLLIMSAIPLTLTGIMPGFYLLNLVTAGQAGGFEDPVFFTATAMIGMIALGGIVIRNSLVLLEFISSRTKSGQPLKEAVLQSGAIRLRPIVLTAMTTALGVWPITLDPIFSGLAWALIFGLVASTLFTLVLVPVVYYMIYR